MPQNPLTSKISSIIGIILLLLVIAFTIFINFFVEESVEEIKEEAVMKKLVSSIEIVEVDSIKFQSKAFHTKDFIKLCKLKNIHTNYISVGSSTKKAYIDFYEKVSQRRYYPDLNTTISYGKLEFENIYPTKKKGIFAYKSFSIDLENPNVDKLRRIGSLFLDYQINSVITKYEYGDFTCIYFKDGRRVFLVNKNAKIIDKYYYKLIKEAEYINDSTKVASPEMVRRFNRENEF